jgi:queuosine precursor transporter
VGTVNYLYKLLMSFLLIPLIYAVRRGIERYLGPEAARDLRERARC